MAGTAGQAVTSGDVLPFWDMLVRVLLALVPAALIGLEREMSGHMAGIRTHTLVALGACLFALAGTAASGQGDVTRIAGQVASGIGFLGAGVMIRDGYRVRGLTTAASMWVVAAIGVAAGLGAVQAIFAVAIITLLVLAGLRWTDRFLPRKSLRRITVSVGPGVNIATLVPELTPYIGTMSVSAVESTEDGGHKLIGRASVSRETDVLGAINDLVQHPDVTSAEFHT